MKSTRRKFELFSRLQALGFSYDESAALRRIEMTLQRWAEMECGSEHGCIERDELTGKPYRVVCRDSGKDSRYPVADREAGALKRLKAIMSQHPDLVPYHQGDPRGCALYVLRKAEVVDYAAKHQINFQTAASMVYTRELAVCD